jgi:hypothetical protein
MDFAAVKDVIGLVGTVVGVGGFIVGLVWHFGDVKDKNIREWQKVVVQKILQQSGGADLPFNRIKELYRGEAQAFAGATLSKADISEDTLRRVMVELVSSNIAVQGAGDVYSLKISLVAPDLAAEAQRRNFLDNQKLTDAALKYLKVNGYRNTAPELVSQLSQTTGIDAEHVELFLMISLQQGSLVLDDQKRVALASAAFSKG